MYRSTRSASKRGALKDLVSPDNIPCPQVPTHSTKQKENVKKRVKVTRTESFRETFPGRLEWKSRHFTKPVTSTPTASVKSIKKDIENCFGFEDSSESDGEKNYSILISPIPKGNVKSVVNIVKLKQPTPPPPDLSKSIFVDEVNEQNLRVKPSAIGNPSVEARPLTPPPPDLSSSIFVDEVNEQCLIKPSDIGNPDVEVRINDSEPRKNLNEQSTETASAVTSTLRRSNRETVRKAAKAKPEKPKRLLKKTTKVNRKARSPTPPPPDLSSSIFVDEVNEQYLRIKPSDIGNPGVEVKDFNDLLQRYNFDEEKEVEFRIDPTRALKTYPSKRNSNEGQFRSKSKLVRPQKKVKKIKRVTEKTKKLKPTGSRKFGKKNEYEDDNTATMEWLEMKNKEFQEILKVNLIVERSVT